MNNQQEESGSVLIRKAIEYAKTNPNTGYATELRRRIEAGEYNKELKEAGLNQFINKNTLGYVDRVVGDVQQSGKNVVSSIQKGAEELNAGTKKGGIGGAFQAVKGLVRSGLRTAGEVASTAFAPVVEAPGIKQGLEAIGENVVKPVLETKPGQALLAFGQKHPEAFKDLQNIIDVSTLGGAKAVEKPVASAVGKGIDQIPKAIDAATTGAINSIPAVRDAATKGGNYVFDKLATENPTKLAKIKTGLADNLNEYASEFSKSRGNMEKAADKIEGFDYGKHIAERNLLPDVAASGRFDGTSIIRGLEGENKALSEAVTKKLQSSANRYSLMDFANSLKDDVIARSSSADVASAESFVDRFIEGARKKYKLGQEITDEQLYKIKQDADAGFNYNSPNADVNASKIIADNARKTIRGTDEELSRLLDAQSKNYEAIRITDSLKNYKVKAGNLTTRLAQLGGGILGATAVEGSAFDKILAATLGAVAGTKLIQAIQQATFISPVARAAIRKEMLRTAGEDITKGIMKKLDNAAQLTTKESKIVEQVGNKIKSKK